MMRLLCATIFLCGAVYSWGAQIAAVSVDQPQIEAGGEEQCTVAFRISEPARVSLHIFDPRDLLIRTVSSRGVLPGGEHSLAWDSLDEAGRPVPPEAYRYTLLAATEQGNTVEHDLSDLTGSKRMAVQHLHWDSEAGLLRYSISRPGRVNIRIGLKNDGPLLRTALSWQPRAAGRHSEPWDGMDASRVLDLSEHQQLDLWGDAFSFSDNTILVTSSTMPVALIHEMPWGRVQREVKRPVSKRMFEHSQQSHESRGDFAISLSLPESLPRNETGAAIVSGIVPVRLDIAPSDRGRALSRRFEPVFFVDGAFAFENETGFLPMTWLWNTEGTNPGSHFLTANLRGYEGNFGMATVKVEVVDSQ